MNNVVAGGLVALSAFCLAVVWDLIKFRRDRDKRRRAALAGFCEEMSANREAAGNNLTLIAVEAKQLKEGEAKGLLNTLSLLETGAWTIARLDLHHKLLQDHDLVRRLQIVGRNAAIS